jgi:hypothetical protein
MKPSFAHSKMWRPRYEKTKQTQTDRGQKTRFLLKNRGACNKKQKEVVRLEVYIEG